MILSDVTLKLMLNSGELVVDPLTEEQIQPASIDVRLGDHFLKVDENRSDVIRLDKEVRYEGIRKLIGITPVGVKDLVPAGLRSRMSKGIKRLNSKHAERKPLNAETERLLRTEFDEQIVKLSGLTGRNLDHWRVDTE